MKLFELDQTLYSNEGKRIRQKINEDGTKQDIKFCKMHSTESKQGDKKSRQKLDNPISLKNC